GGGRNPCPFPLPFPFPSSWPRVMKGRVLCFRLGSSLVWIGALILFFLPWYAVNVVRIGRGKSSYLHTLSGAQIAWGGATDTRPGEWTNIRFIDFAEVASDSSRWVVCGLLTAYCISVIFGIWLTVLVTPSRRRARSGMLLALVLLGLLLIVGIMGFENPI